MIVPDDRAVVSLARGEVMSHDAILARLRALLAKGQSQREAAQQLGLSRSAVNRRVVQFNLPRKQRRLTASERRQVYRRLRTGQRVDEIAAAMQRGRRTIYRYRRLWTEREAEWAKRKAERPVEPGAIVFRTLDAPRACPRHGPVTVWPCVMCRALGLGQ